MPSEPIPLAVDRRDRRVNFTQMLWTSAGSPWSGFRLERHGVGPVGRLNDFAVPDILLGLCLRGSAQMQFGSDKNATRSVVKPGQFTLLAAGPQAQAITWSGTRETLYLSISQEQLGRLMGPDRSTEGRGITPQYGIVNPQVSRLMLNMFDEVRAGCPAGRLYGEALSLALANYLLDRYGAPQPGTPRPALTFSRPVAARVREYIQSHLDENLSLLELAEVAGLSSHHFSLVFKNTFDATPHHYLLERRIDEAKRRLAGGQHSIVETALDVGFSNQSHFTRVFRRFTGESPRQFQRRNG